MYARAYRKSLINVGGYVPLLRFLEFLWKSIPYRPRHGVTYLFIKTVLFQKRLLKIDQQTEITGIKDLGSMAYWGFPKVDLNNFYLTVDRAVDRPLSLSWRDVKLIPLVERQMRMDCFGGFGNNTVMSGVTVGHLLDLAGASPQARRVVFHFLDGYYVSLEIKDLREREAFLASTTNREELLKFGFPLRLAMRATTAISGPNGSTGSRW